VNFRDPAPAWQVARAALFAVLLGALPAQLPAQSTPWQTGFQSITARELYHHVAVLADDSMRGRNTPSPELEKAAAYISSQFSHDGLQPAPGLNSFYQLFPVVRTRLSSPNAVTFELPDTVLHCRIKQDFVPLQLSASGTVRAPVVFVGYGISAPEFNYDDYAGIDVHGKIVLMFTHEPRERDSTDVFLGPKATEHSKNLIKMLTALDHGAVGMILVTDPLNHIARRPPNVWPSLMRRKLPGMKTPLRLVEEKSEALIGVHVSKRVGERLLESAGANLAALQREIDSTLVPHSFPLPVTAELQVTVEGDTELVKNVVAYLPGSDPKQKDQVVIVGAHYDHIGAANDTVIYNGADDNASGTSGVLEIAQAFALNPARPKRSLLFICFAGEEKGLFGSRYYVHNPLFPLDSTVAMINLDMISRNDSNQVSVAGKNVSPELFGLVEEANTHVGLEVTTEAEKFFRQSDHYSFYRKHVPVLFFNTLEHPDLHKPTDDVDKIIPEKMQKISRLAYLVVWELANSSERPSFHEIGAGSKTASGEAGQGETNEDVRERRHAMSSIRRNSRYAGIVVGLVVSAALLSSCAHVKKPAPKAEVGLVYKWEVGKPLRYEMKSHTEQNMEMMGQSITKRLVHSVHARAQEGESRRQRRGGFPPGFGLGPDSIADGQHEPRSQESDRQRGGVPPEPHGQGTENDFWRREFRVPDWPGDEDEHVAELQQSAGARAGAPGADWREVGHQGHNHYDAKRP